MKGCIILSCRVLRYDTVSRLKEITDCKVIILFGFKDFGFSYNLQEIHISNTGYMKDHNNFLEFYYEYLSKTFNFPLYLLRKIRGEIISTLHEIGHSKTINENNWYSIKEMNGYFIDAWEDMYETYEYRVAYRKQPQEYLADAYAMDIICDHYYELKRLSDLEKQTDVYLTNL